MKKFEGILLACDMDGTLLDENRCISPENESAIQYFTQEGGRFSLATGRAPDAIQSYLGQLVLNAPYSLLNGSLILNASHQVLYCAGMPKETIDLIADILSKFSQLGCEIFAGQKILIRNMSPRTQKHMDMLNLQYQMVAQQQLDRTDLWCKINFTGSKSDIENVSAYVRQNWTQFCVASSFPEFCEITRNSVHKGAAMRNIANMLSIRPNGVCAIGDSYNDEQMLIQADISFAPKNADAGILKIADHIVEDHNHHAVAQAIHWMDTHF